MIHVADETGDPDEDDEEQTQYGGTEDAEPTTSIDDEGDGTHGDDGEDEDEE